MIGISERLAVSDAEWRSFLEQFACTLRVACPGIIKSFDATEQTVKVQLALTEAMLKPQGGSGSAQVFTRQPKMIPELLHVPILLPRAGGFSVTLPIQAGDECLVIFGDMCIDAWWQNGDVQNQIELRRHDLSDGFAVLAPWNQTRNFSPYFTGGLRVQKDDGSVRVEVTTDSVNIVATNQINLQAPTINITGSSQVNIGNPTKIDGHDFLPHAHSGVTTGGGDTGGVV